MRCAFFFFFFLDRGWSLFSRLLFSVTLTGPSFFLSGRFFVGAPTSSFFTHLVFPAPSHQSTFSHALKAASHPTSLSTFPFPHAHTYLPHGRTAGSYFPLRRIGSYPQLTHILPFISTDLPFTPFPSEADLSTPVPSPPACCETFTSARVCVDFLAAAGVTFLLGLQFLRHTVFCVFFLKCPNADLSPPLFLLLT